MKYRYHTVLWFKKTNTKHFHSFNSDKEILEMKDIRDELEKGNMTFHGGFNVENISKTINN